MLGPAALIDCVSVLQADFDISESDDEVAPAPAAKRARMPPAHLQSDSAVDAETAWAVGFTPGAVTTEEEDLLPIDADESIYTKVGVQWG